MHIVLVGNAPHVIKIPILWGTNNSLLNERIQSQESGLFHVLKGARKSLTKRKGSGDVIYYLDTMPVYINSSGSVTLTKGVMRPLPYGNQ